MLVCRNARQVAAVASESNVPSCDTAATLLLLDGVPAIVVSRMLGHANVAFTLQTYGHVLAEMREMARDAMEKRFGSSLAANPEKSAAL